MRIAPVELYCSRCGNKLPDQAAFCARCGSPVGEAPQSRPASVPHQPDLRMRRWLILLGALAVVWWAVFGHGSDPAPSTSASSASQAVFTVPTWTPAPTPAAMGTPVQGKNWRYTVADARRVAGITDPADGRVATAKGQWLVVLLTLENAGRENFSINTWDFEVHDGSGGRYRSTDNIDAAFAVNRGRTRLGSQVPPGVSVQSALAFDLAPNATGLTLWLVQDKTAVDLRL